MTGNKALQYLNVLAVFLLLLPVYSTASSQSENKQATVTQIVLLGQGILRQPRTDLAPALLL